MSKSKISKSKRTRKVAHKDNPVQMVLLLAADRARTEPWFALLDAAEAVGASKEARYRAIQLEMAVERTKRVSADGSYEWAKGRPDRLIEAAARA